MRIQETFCCGRNEEYRLKDVNGKHTLNRHQYLKNTIIIQ